MLTLCLDTAYKYLTCCLIKDDEIIASYCQECFKRQSEEIFDALEKVFVKANINRKDIDSICISEGPGSYTGVRIAMSIAKTIAQLMNLKLYTISTLRLYAGNKPNTLVIMNARADRAYVGIYDKENIVKDDAVYALNDIDVNNYDVVGDGGLVNKIDTQINIPEAFLATKDLWTKVDNIAYLVPKYLKESESYLK